MNVLVDTHVVLWAATAPSRLSRAAARRLWRALPENGWQELPVLGAHVLAVRSLPPLHRDPFDRLLLAQSSVEGWPLLTADDAIVAYPGNVLRA